MKSRGSLKGTGLVLAALQFAAHKHRDQRRKGANALPYINHPIGLAHVLWSVGNVRDATTLAAALLHDTIEDTETAPEEIRGQFGDAVASVVEEVTDVKWLKKSSRKRIQVARAGRASRRAKLVKLADKICNLQDILASPPADWSVERMRQYFEWAKSVVDEVRGASTALANRFDSLYRQQPKPSSPRPFTGIPRTTRKLREAKFFLAQLERDVMQLQEPREHAEFHFSAFLAAARSVTSVLESEEPERYAAWSREWRTELSAADKKLLGKFTFARNRALKRETPAMALDIANSNLDPYAGLEPGLRHFFFETQDQELPGYRSLVGRLAPCDTTTELLPLCREYEALLSRFVRNICETNGRSSTV